MFTRRNAIALIGGIAAWLFSFSRRQDESEVPEYLDSNLIMLAGGNADGSYMRIEFDGRANAIGFVNKYSHRVDFVKNEFGEMVFCDYTYLIELKRNPGDRVFRWKSSQVLVGTGITSSLVDTSKPFVLAKWNGKVA